MTQAVTCHVTSFTDFHLLHGLCFTWGENKEHLNDVTLFILFVPVCVWMKRFPSSSSRRSLAPYSVWFTRWNHPSSWLKGFTCLSSPPELHPPMKASVFKLRPELTTRLTPDHRAPHICMSLSWFCKFRLLSLFFLLPKSKFFSPEKMILLPVRLIFNRMMIKKIRISDWQKPVFNFGFDRKHLWWFETKIQNK